MRLINVRTLQLEEYFGDDTPQYAILSHTWGKEEVSFDEFGTASAEHKQGYQKIKSACQLAAAQGHDYIWIDTCCIDKRSSADLSEAINSMCAWYQRSSICYAYLVDIGEEMPHEEYFWSRWWSRGWTLQELLAPSNVVFLDKYWDQIGTKNELRSEISRYTGIKEQALVSMDDARSLSIAERMSWASERETTRVEDRAYSLLGLFDVNMPLLYGEGLKAFFRLQEEILKTSSDQSIFAWGLAPDTNLSFEQVSEGIPNHGSLVRPDNYAPAGPLAPFPDLFWKSRGISPIFMNREQTPFGMTNLGIQIRLPIADTGLFQSRRGVINYCIGVLACSHSERDGEFLGILLDRIHETHQYARMCGEDGAKSTFFFSTRHVLSANISDVLLMRSPSEQNQSNWFLQLGAPAGLGPRLAIYVDPAFALQGWKVTEIILNDSLVSVSDKKDSGPVDPDYRWLSLDDWREHNICSVVLGSAMDKKFCTLVVETHNAQPESSFCDITVASAAAGPLGFLRSKDNKVLMDETKTFTVRCKTTKPVQTEELDVKIKVNFRSKTIFLQQIFIVAINIDSSTGRST